MLYRGLSVEEARTRFSAIVPSIPPPVVEVRRRRVIKTEPIAPAK
jgi:hypothetical protein